MSDANTFPHPPWLADDLPPADRRAVTRRMARLIREWEAAGDRRAIFLSCYSMMTRNMLAAIHARDFLDPDWVHDLLERFAEYYFAALHSFDHHINRTPPPWRLAFDATRNADMEVLQHLLLGINAHINYDLVLCLGEVLQDEWRELSADERQARYRDHCHVNDIIAATIDAVQDRVVERYAPWMDVVDRAMGRADEWLVTRLIAYWRDEVWKHAIERVTLPDAAAREAHRQELERSVVARGHLIRMDVLTSTLGKLGL